MMEQYFGGVLSGTSNSVSTFNLSLLSQFIPVLGKTLLTPLISDCSQNITKVCRIIFCLPVPGSGHLDWFKACHRLCDIWSNTFLQLPGMLLPVPSSYQKDYKRGIFLRSHSDGSVASWWPSAGEFSARRFCSHRDTGKLTQAGDKSGVSNILFCLLEMSRH